MAKVKSSPLSKKTTAGGRGRNGQTSKRPSVGKNKPRRPIPQLADIAPELKPHIVSQVKPPSPDHYWSTLAGVGVTLLGILVATGSAMWLVSFKQPRPRAVAVQPIAKSTPLTATAPLTGLPAAPETVTQRPWAVVVENFFTVRPQSGLGSADIVFESPTEGGITRLVAIYQSQLPKLIGPVRSARSYFNDWARPFAPLYSHSGGSDKALQQLRNGYGDITDVNEFFHGAAYTRNTSINPPHNLFTTPERFLTYARNNNFALVSEVPKLNFVTKLPPAPTINHLTLPYLPSEYEVTYEYQAAAGVYQRLVDGTTQLDANSNQVLTVKNVIVIFTDIDPIPGDPLLRVNLRTLGTGEARVYTGGLVYSGTWRKNSADSLIELTDNLGQTLPLQPGNTWVSVMDTSAAVDLSAGISNKPELY